MVGAFNPAALATRRVPARPAEKLSKSLASAAFTSPACVAFGRRHFRMNRLYLPAEIGSSGLRRSGPISKRFGGQSEAKKSRREYDEEVFAGRRWSARTGHGSPRF